MTSNIDATDKAIQQNEFVERYISNLQWNSETPDEIKSYVAGNLRGFWTYILASHRDAIDAMLKVLQIVAVKRKVSAENNSGLEYFDMGRWMLCDELHVEFDNLLQRIKFESVNSEIKAGIDRIRKAQEGI